MPRRRYYSVTVEFEDGTEQVFVGKAAERIGDFIEGQELKPEPKKEAM